MQASPDPDFDAWLAMTEGLMDEFETKDVPQLPADMYSADGLAVAERALLERFATLDDALAGSEADKESADKFARFLGETFRRVFGGTWRVSPDDGATPLVQYPGADSVPLDPYRLMTAALLRRTGREWVTTLQRTQAFLAS